MAFFLPSSTSTSTTNSLSSSPLPVLRQLDSEDESGQSDDGNRSLRHRRSDDFQSTRSGFTMFGLLSRRIEYISGASASDISSLESSSESEVESWSRRATLGDVDDEAEDEFDDVDDRHTNTRRRTSRSTRGARSPSGRRRSADNIIQVHDDHPVVELSVGTSPSHGGARTITAATTTTDHHTGPSTISEPNLNVAPSTNQIEGEETVKRRGHRTTHGSTEVGRRSNRRVKLRNRRRDSHFYEGYICKYAFLNIVVGFGRFILLTILFYFIPFLLSISRQSISLKNLFFMSIPCSTRSFPRYYSMFWIGLCVDGACSPDNDELVWIRWK